MNKLQAHFKKMQSAAARYLAPSTYVDRDGKSASFEDDPKPDRDELFVNDMIYMLDGPEQRAAEAEVDQELEDLRALVRSLMRDLHVVDHVVTLNEGTSDQRTIVASNLMS
jgi:hypothetical protein